MPQRAQVYLKTLFLETGALPQKESELIAATVTGMLLAGIPLSHGTLIISLKKNMSDITDRIMLDVYRKALETVLWKTPDSPGV